MDVRELGRVKRRYFLYHPPRTRKNTANRRAVYIVFELKQCVIKAQAHSLTLCWGTVTLHPHRRGRPHGPGSHHGSLQEKIIPREFPLLKPLGWR